MPFSDDNVKGLCLAVSSSIFIGSSFIVKKKGLRAAGTQGLRAGRPRAGCMSMLHTWQRQHAGPSQQSALQIVV
jgi:Magnesium transporter NIPA